MPFYKKDEVAEEKIKEMGEIIKSEKFEESYIRQLVANQKGELSVLSKYYKGNITEGNWSLEKDDSDIEDLDKEIIDVAKVLSSEVDVRTKNAEYSYVFIPSYYAVISLILYYLINKRKAEKIYGLKNAVIRHDYKKSEKFYGGLPFIIKYIEKLPKDDPIRYDFADIMEELLIRKSGLESNKENDDFINDIIDCIRKSRCKDFILEKRIKDFKDASDKYFCIDFKKELKKDEELLNYTMVDDYKILMHNDVKKDWKHLKDGQVKKAKEKISKTPKHPKNDSPKDSESLKGSLKGWFSQRISKKDRLVYKIEKNKKIVYIATVCDHYKDASSRAKSTVAYR